MAVSRQGFRRPLATASTRARRGRQDPRDPCRQRQVGTGDRRAHRHLRTRTTGVPGRTAALGPARGRGPPGKKGGPAVRAPGAPSAEPGGVAVGRGWAGCASEAEQLRRPPVASHEYVLSSLALARLQPSASGGYIGCQRDPNDRYLKGFSPLLGPKKSSRARMSLAECSSIDLIISRALRRGCSARLGGYPALSRANLAPRSMLLRLSRG